MSTVKVYTVDQIRSVIDEPSFATNLIEAIKRGFVAYEKGKFFSAPIQTMGVPPFPFIQADGYAAQTCVKSGYFLNEDYYVIKVASGGNPWPNSGVMQLYSQSNGKLVSILLDDGVLTEIRTAAVGSLAAQLLAPKNIRCIGVVGTGVQARYQVAMLSLVTNCRHLLVWGRSRTKGQGFCDEMSSKGWDAKLSEKADDLLGECDFIITVTCTREPVLGLDPDAIASIKGPLHITCIGADAPSKHELNPALVRKADLLVADSIDQTAHRGEFQQAIREGLVSHESILPLGKLIETRDAHRTEKDSRITIFDSSGVALQDCVVAQMALKALQGDKSSQ